MNSFFIKAYNDYAYTKIFEKIMEKGLTFNKEVNGGTIFLEVIGSVNDHRFFGELINSMNDNNLQNVASINEF